MRYLAINAGATATDENTQEDKNTTCPQKSEQQGHFPSPSLPRMHRHSTSRCIAHRAEIKVARCARPSQHDHVTRRTSNRKSICPRCTEFVTDCAIITIMLQTESQRIGSSRSRMSACTDEAWDRTLMAILAVDAANVAMKPKPRPTNPPMITERTSCTPQISHDDGGTSFKTFCMRWDAQARKK